MDIVLHLIDHVDPKQPVYSVDPAKGEITPIYFKVQQTGGSFLCVHGPFIFKREAIYRNF